MNKRVDSKQLVLSIDADENLEESLGIISCESSQESIGMRNPKMRIGAVSHSERNGRIYPKVFRNSIAPAKKRQNKTQKKTTHAIKGEKKREAPTNQENIRSQTYYSSRNFSGKRRMEIMPPTAWHSAVSQHRRSDERFSPVHQLFWGTYPPKPAFLVFEILLLEIVLTNEKPLMLKLG